MLKKLIHVMAETPVIFNLLRRILEFNYAGEKGVVRREIAANQQLLDLGCGTGELCREFVAANYRGIDINKGYVDFATKTYPGYRFETMDATQLRFGDASFDVVLISGVLHHCENGVIAAILAEVARVLRPGGKVVVWEDVPTRGRLNLVGKAIQRLDEGDNILSAEAYAAIFQRQFNIEKTYPMRSGICDYQVFILTASTR
jgi:ubiquinone/menaquinone biosynthesis C-methylase UbiE